MAEINKGKAGDAAKKFGGGAPNSNACQVCSKSVYPMEKLEVEGLIFHKFCFKCETCKRTLSLGSYASLSGKYYCKPHLKQLFALKGNYDEGFGREQRKADWDKKGNAAGTGKTQTEKPKTEKPKDEPQLDEPESNGHTEEEEVEEAEAPDVIENGEEEGEEIESEE